MKRIIPRALLRIRLRCRAVILDFAKIAPGEGVKLAFGTGHRLGPYLVEQGSKQTEIRVPRRTLRRELGLLRRAVAPAYRATGSQILRRGSLDSLSRGRAVVTAEVCGELAPAPMRSARVEPVQIPSLQGVCAS